MKKLIALALLLGCGAAQAATLLGMGELFEPGDLTVIERDDGLFAEYLDLTRWKIIDQRQVEKESQPEA